MKNNPFGDLKKQLGLPDESPGASPGLRDFHPRDFDTSTPRRAVVRYERSGRGGKEVTVVEQLGLSQAELLVWLKELKSALGCGGSVESDTLMLQGDQRSRLPKLLTERGVKKTIVS
jgi:translation initiation factor 1